MTFFFISLLFLGSLVFEYYILGLNLRSEVYILKYFPVLKIFFNKYVPLNFLFCMCMSYWRFSEFYFLIH
jgi:hypothetical protein